MEEIDFEKLIPELGLMKDVKLRGVVQSIWMEILRSSQFEKVEEIPNFPSKDYPAKHESFPQMSKISLLEHTRAVTVNALNVATTIRKMHGIEVDLDYLIAAGLLHDVDKMVKVRKIGDEVVRRDTSEFAEGSSALWAQALARRMGLRNDLVETIAPEKDIPADTLENVILLHSDLTDADALRWSGGIRDLFITRMQ